ncbi:MAG: hypothetical protein IPK71_10575 [Myxococcales bacterium]|nr:hypothetical protein [Myxococcales bacterium]
MTGIAVQIFDETIIHVFVADTTRPAELQVDNHIYEVRSNGAVAIYAPPQFRPGERLRREDFFPTVVIMPRSSEPAPPSDAAKRTCIECAGRYYCITNGCANTPCGSICD